MQSAITWFRVLAIAVDLALVALALSKRNEEGLSRREKSLLAVGALAHLAAVGCRAAAIRFLPLVAVPDVLVLLSLLLVLAVFVETKRTGKARVRSGLYLASAAALSLCVIIRTPSDVSHELRSMMLPIHVGGAIAAYACMTVNLVLCLAAATRRRANPAEGPDEKANIFGPARRFAVVGFALYAVFVLGMGMVWAKTAWGRYWGWDPKETLALLTFCAYGLYLYFEYVLRVRSVGVRLVLSCLAYALVLLTLFLGMRLSSLHGHG